MDKGRKADIAELKRDLKKTKDPTKKFLIERAGKKIAAEQHDGWVRSARHKMIDERLKGRQANVRDVQDEMINRERGGRMSYGFMNVKYWPFKK